MRGRGRMVQWVLGGYSLAVLAGCVSMDDHRKIKAQNQTMAASKEGLAQDLYDARSANESLLARNESIERELETNNALVANLRKENELLEEVRRSAEAALDEMAEKQTLGDLTITGPKLPEPLHNALKRFADANPTLVSYNPGRGTVKWKADLLFALGSDIVKQTSTASLKSFTDILKSAAAANFEVIVVGHTDNVPIVRPATKVKHPTNWHLSAHRAISVATLLQKNGYAPERIGVMGVGEYRPIADNGSPEGAAQNRRVEVYLVPVGVIAHADARGVQRLDGEALASVRP